MAKSLIVLYFWRFSSLRERTEKVSTKHETCYQNPSPNRWQINAKFMLGKVMQKTQNIIKTANEKGTENNYKSIKNGVPNKCEKRARRIKTIEELGIPVFPVNLWLRRYTTAEKTTFRKWTFRETKHSTYSNTPWAPSGPLRMYWTQGSPGLRGQASGGFRLVSVACSIFEDVSQKSYFWTTKSHFRSY